MYPKPATVRTQSARRDFLGAGAALVGIAAAGPLLAQQPPGTAAVGVKGPRVWLDMDQAELDTAYDQSKYAPNLPQITKRYATNSEAARSRLGAPRRFAYGPTAIEGLDVYTTKRPNAPINVFISGPGSGGADEARQGMIEVRPNPLFEPTATGKPASAAQLKR